MDDSVELLIKSVEARPALYNTTLKEYANINIKKTLWEEVCEQVVPNWSAMHGEERSKVNTVLHKEWEFKKKKWLSLRSCFARELRHQKAHKSGDGVKKRRKYIYFQKLSFLLPSSENGQTTSNLDPQDEASDHEENDAAPPLETPPTGRPSKRKTPASENQNDDSENSLLELSSEKKSSGGDEDVLFALSLIPTLKSPDDFTKFDLKLKIMELVKSVKWPEHVRYPAGLELLISQDVAHSQPPTSSSGIHYNQSVRQSRQEGCDLLERDKKNSFGVFLY